MTITRKGATVARVVEGTLPALALASCRAASCLPLPKSLAFLEPGTIMTRIFPADSSGPLHLGLGSKQE